MVNTTIVSQHIGDLPHEDGASRKIPGDGPLYAVDDVLRVLGERGGNAINAWTQKCTKDMQRWEIDADDLVDLIKIGLHRGVFRGSEWCQPWPDGPWAACDCYLVVRRQWVPAAHKDMDFDYYIKFAINKKGTLLLVVSCHPPEDRR